MTDETRLDEFREYRERMNERIFGAGHLGKFHLNNWLEIPDVELVGFFDPDDHNAKAVEEKYHLRNFLRLVIMIKGRVG